MEIERGMTFRDLGNTKHYIANVFLEGDEEVITYRYWLKTRKRWIFKTEFKVLFLIQFNYGWKWE